MPAPAVRLSLCRAALKRRAARDSGLARWEADLRLVRGRCLARRCRSRWGVIRVSLDFRDPSGVDRLATVECAACGRTWRRVRATVPLRNADGTQAVRLTLILPGEVNRWRSRGTWHREGDDPVLRNASLGDADEAASAHRARMDTRARAKAAAAARKAEREAADHEATMALLARWHERDAERAAEEAAARERDAA